MIARLSAYWLTVGMALWFVASYLGYSSKKGAEWLGGDGFYLKKLEVEDYFGVELLTSMGTSILVGMLGHLLITSNDQLPINRLAWLFRPLQHIRRLGGTKMNQWGLGDHSFWTVFVLFVVVPVSAYFWGGVHQNVVHDPAYFAEEGEPVPEGYALYMLSIYFGLAGSLSMAFFLIPVARHNILLSAVGWSPVHALKLHILSGYLAYAGIALHGITYVIYMFMRVGDHAQERLVHRVFPSRHCWVWKPSEDQYAICFEPWWNITGIVAFLFMTVIILTSLHWVRRKYYRLFYICHVSFGFLTTIFSIMHWNFLVIFLFPSLVYYVASTTPVLIQALASRFRGGVKITDVVVVKNSGGCVEVKIAASSTASAALNNEACLVVKMCVPRISLVWHPFTVYTRCDDFSAVRFLMRPIGPFTKALASSLVEIPRPIMILDGFHRGGDRINEALCHDVVSIVSGGVALTPFLSMIPALLHTLKEQESPVTKKIVLHWACREDGLATFVTENYLNGFKRLASDIGNGFQLKIVVYHTLKKAGANHKTLAEEVFSDYDDEEYDTKKATFESDGTPSVENSDEANGTPVTASNTVTSQPGHDIQPARFMPALYSRVVHNIPQFVLMSASLWIGLVVYTHYYNNGHFKVLEHVSNICSTIVWLLVSIALATCFELFFLVAQKYFPQPIPESYVVSEYGSVGGVDKPPADVDSGKMIEVDRELEHCHERPTAVDILAGLESSNCPGIFLCGPTGLTQMVRDAAMMENSHFGLTRYALYEEPFEM